MAEWVFMSRCATPDPDGKIRCKWSTVTSDPTQRNRDVAAHRNATDHQSYRESMRRTGADA